MDYGFIETFLSGISFIDYISVSMSDFRTMDRPDTVVPSAPNTQDSSATRRLPKTPTEQKLAEKGQQQDTTPSRTLKNYSWKAFSLRAPYQLFMICLSVSLFIVIESLRQMSNRKNGLLHLESPDVSTGLEVAYNYLPTIIAVIYSACWFFIDADAKRLEPYFQIRAEQSNAKYLLLDYAFELPFMVPIRAIGHRHWMVALVSFQFLLISLVLPASMGALIAIEQVSVLNNNAKFTASGKMLQSHDILEGDYISQTRAIVSYGSRHIPSWTTIDYAVEPFVVSDGVPVVNETWYSETNIAFAEPTCSPFNMRNQDIIIKCCIVDSTGIMYYDIYFSADMSLEADQNCELSISMIVSAQVGSEFDRDFLSIWIPATSDTYVVEQSGYYINVTGANQRKTPERIPTGINLGDPRTRGPSFRKDLGSSCPSDLRITGLFVVSQFGTDSPDYVRLLETERKDTSFARKLEQALLTQNRYDMRMFACSTEYFSSLGKVTVNGHDGSILDVTPSSTKKQLTTQEFNISSFESILDLNMIPELFHDLNVKDFTLIRDLENPTASQLHKVRRLDPTDPGAWAIHSKPGLAEIVLTGGLEFFNETSLTEISAPYEGFAITLERLYRLAFASAYQSIMKSTPSNTYEISGSIEQKVFALVMSRPFSILAEVLLAGSALTLCTTLFVYSRRTSILRSDPDSVSSQVSLIADQFFEPEKLQMYSESLDVLSTQTIRKYLRNFELHYSDKSSALNLTPRPSFAWVERRDRRHGQIAPKSQKADKVPYLKKDGIALTIFIILGLTATMLFLRFFSSGSAGLEIARKLSAFETQLIFSFLPSLIATYIEACWISVHRDLSILECFVRLRKGGASALDSLSLRYSTRPPAIAFFLSLKKRHHLIAFVSLLSVSTSVLNVAMAGLFSQSFKSVQRDREFVRALNYSMLLPNVRASLDTRDAWSKIWTDLSSEVELSDFTHRDYSFFPVKSYSEGEVNPVILPWTQFSSTTLGLGATLNCSNFSANPQNYNSELGIFRQYMNSSLVSGKVVYIPPISTSNLSYACVTGFTEQIGMPSLNFNLHFGTEVNTIGKINNNLSEIVHNNQNSTKASVLPQSSCYSGIVLSHTNGQANDTTIYMCQPQLEIGIFNITHNAAGVVSSYIKVPDQDYPVGSDIRVEKDKLVETLSDLLIQYSGTFSKYSWESLRVTSMGKYDYPGLIMTKLGKRTKATSVPELANRMFAMTFANSFTLFRNLVPESEIPSNSSIDLPTGSIITREPCLVPSVPAFTVSITLLFIYLVGCALIVARRRHRYAGPRMPTSIGSLIPWVVHSRMLEDFHGLHYMSSKERDEILAKLGRTYGFGRFRGRDGKVRLGIEYEECLIVEGAHSAF